MLYTGTHFRDTPDSVKRISISNSDPHSCRVDMSIKELMPTWDMVEKAKRDSKYFLGEFKTIYLAKVNRHDSIIEYLLREGAKMDIILLCWEHSRENCHRGFLADHILEKFGFDIPEWIRAYAEESKKQGELF